MIRYHNIELIDYPDVRILSSRRIRHGRKTHECAYCRKAIPAGSPSDVLVMLNEGAFEVTRIHPGALECTL